MTKLLLTMIIVFLTLSQVLANEQSKGQPQKIELQTTISAAQEEPKFMSILPWQDLARVSVSKPSLMLAPRTQFNMIDPVQLQRKLAIHKQQSNLSEQQIQVETRK